MTYAIKRNAPSGTTYPFAGLANALAAQAVLLDLHRGMERMGFTAMISTPDRSVFKSPHGLVEYLVCEEPARIDPETRRSAAVV